MFSYQQRRRRRALHHRGRSVSLCSQLCVLTSSMLTMINKPWIQCLSRMCVSVDIFF